MNTNKGFGLHKETLFVKAPRSNVLHKDDEKEGAQTTKAALNNYCSLFLHQQGSKGVKAGPL